jgi:hypothetical protein
MSKFFIPAAALITLLVVTDAAGASSGASRHAPGHEMHGRHGASANAPGRLYLMHNKTPINGRPGAAGYAPSHVR